MNFYRMKITTYAYGKNIGCRSFKTIEDEQPKDEEIQLTWDNLYEITNKYCLNGFTIYDWGRGRIIEIYSNNISIFNGEHTKIKERKTSEIPMSVKITYEKIDVALKDVLEYSDGEKAIQYLKERGMTICGMGR